jgi:hypothetical protein
VKTPCYSSGKPVNELEGFCKTLTRATKSSSKQASNFWDIKQLYERASEICCISFAKKAQSINSSPNVNRLQLNSNPITRLPIKRSETTTSTAFIYTL